MPSLPIIDGPSMDAIREGLFEVGKEGPTYPDLYELPFVDEDLEVVLPSFLEDFGAHGGLKSIAFSGLGT